MISPRIVILTAAVIMGAAAATASGAPAPGILYSVDAAGPLVVRGADGMRLSLPSQAPATWFTDRPQRRVGATTIRAIADVWAASGFASDPPNAALLLHRGTEDRTHVVELTRPRRSGDGSRVSFRIRAIEGSSEAGYNHRDAISTGRYRRAQVFIDDAAVPLCGFALTGPTVCLLQGVQWYGSDAPPDARNDAVTTVGARGSRTGLTVSACRVNGSASYTGRGVHTVDVGALSNETLPVSPCPTATALATPTSTQVAAGNEWWVANYGTEVIQVTVR